MYTHTPSNNRNEFAKDTHINTHAHTHTNTHTHTHTHTHTGVCTAAPDRKEEKRKSCEAKDLVTTTGSIGAMSTHTHERGCAASFRSKSSARAICMCIYTHTHTHTHRSACLRVFFVPSQGQRMGAERQALGQEFKNRSICCWHSEVL